MSWFDWFKSSNDEYQAYRTATIYKRRSIIEEGVLDGLSGAKCWENPYVSDADDPADMQCWYAGWCKGRQQFYKTKEKS